MKLPYPWEDTLVSCGDGWKGIVEDALNELLQTVQAEEDLSLDDLEVSSVETWKGLLKIRVNPKLPEFIPILEHAKLLSLWTCESCGNEGRMREGKQVVRCRDCAVEQDLPLVKEEHN